MKKAFLLIVLTVLPAIVLTSPAMAAVYIKYSNRDSQKHVMKARMDGVVKEVTFDSNTTSAVTIQGSGKAAIVETACGNVEVKDDSKIEIRNGCIKFQ